MREARRPAQIAPDQVADLITESTAGDRGAREALARWCLPRIQRTVLFACGPRPENDDLVQNVMAIVLTKLHTFRGEASFFVWVDRITINEVRRHYRRRRFSLARLREYAAEATDPGSHSPLPEEKVQQAQLGDRLAFHIGKLSPNQRLPVVLSLLHGYTIPEISAMLEVGYDATGKRLQRGKQALKERLRRDPACRSFFKGGVG